MLPHCVVDEGEENSVRRLALWGPLFSARQGVEAEPFHYQLVKAAGGLCDWRGMSLASTRPRTIGGPEKIIVLPRDERRGYTAVASLHGINSLIRSPETMTIPEP